MNKGVSGLFHGGTTLFGVDIREKKKFDSYEQWLQLFYDQ